MNLYILFVYIYNPKIYRASKGRSLTINQVSEICENADNYGGGLYCEQNSQSAARPLACYVAIHAPNYDPLLPHYMQSGKQWTWNQARTECINGVDTYDLASMHTIEQNDAAVRTLI